MEEIKEHWGEMKESEDAGPEPIHSDLMSLLILKGMKMDTLTVHQPCGKENEGLCKVSADCSKMDSTVLHTIQLIQQSKTLHELIEKAKQQIEQGNEVEFDGPQSLPLAPQVPEQPERILKNSFSYPFRYMEKTFNSFSQGEGPPPFRLSANVAKKALRKSVGTILAHTGYDSTVYYILDTLTDIVEEYIKKLTLMMRTAKDQGAGAFPDIMERVFHEMGIGSITELHGFYRTRVIKYHESMLERCNALQDEYASMSLPVLRPVSEEIIRCDPSEVENEEDIPEIHFPALGEGYSADELQPSLEPGFQMLHSLEQEEQLQNLETEEEINVSDSPSQEQGRIAKKRRRGLKEILELV